MSNYATWDLYSLGKRWVEWKRRAEQAATEQQRRSYEGELEIIGREFDRKFFTGPYWPSVDDAEKGGRMSERQAQHEYTCDHCRGTFQHADGWDADAEAEQVWKDAPRGDDRAVICDDCYQEFMGWMRQTHPEALREGGDLDG